MATNGEYRFMMVPRKNYVDEREYGSQVLQASIHRRPAIRLQHPPDVGYRRRSTRQEDPMPKYLLQVTYTAEGTKGLLKDGGSKRRSAAQALIKSLGGNLEALYFAFGEPDVYAIADLPDNVSVAAASLALGASGAATGKTVVLLTPEEIDQATKKSPSYTPPGR